MSNNGILFLQVYRSGIQLWLHDPEGFFYSPEIVVCIVDILIFHGNLGSDQHVVSGKLQGFLNEFLIHGDFYFTICVVALFICSSKNDIFCRITILGFFSLRSFQKPCFFNFFINFVDLFFGKFWIESNNPFFCYLELFNFSCFGVLEFIFKLIYTFFDAV